jgi:lipoate-protein ligase B
MSYGYSLKLIENNRDANIASLGVQLGRQCIEHGVPVSKVARDLGVTRQSVYNWFCGVTAPQDELVGLIREYIANLPR